MISANCRKPWNVAASRRYPPSMSTFARRRSSCQEDQAKEVLELIDKLEQDDDVQKVFHTLA